MPEEHALGVLIEKLNPFTSGETGSMRFDTSADVHKIAPGAGSDLAKFDLELDSYSLEWVFKGLPNRIQRAVRLRYRRPVKDRDGQPLYWVTDFLLIGYEGSDTESEIPTYTEPAAALGNAASGVGVSDGSLTGNIQQYRHRLAKAEESYFSLNFIQRVMVTPPSTAIALIVNLCWFAAWAALLPSGQHLVDLLLPPAYAADISGIDIRPVINFLIFAVLFFTFVISIWVTYFGKNTNAHELAGTVTKTLLGFFVGAATNFLQIAPK
jgi:hypothetical protein